MLKSLTEGALALGEPWYQGSRAGRKCRGLPGSEKAPRQRQRNGASRKACGGRKNGPPSQRGRQHDARAILVRQPPTGSLQQRVGPVEGRHAPPHRDLRQAELPHDRGRGSTDDGPVDVHEERDDERDAENGVPRRSRRGRFRIGKRCRLLHGVGTAVDCHVSNCQAPDRLSWTSVYRILRFFSVPRSITCTAAAPVTTAMFPMIRTFTSLMTGTTERYLIAPALSVSTNSFF